MNNTIEINVVIGSWGSYNACNERALGSKWLNFADYNCWDEIEEELTKQGFILDGIDEELFIQDIENLPSSGTNWDDDIYLYKGYDWEEYGKEMFSSCGYELDERLEDFFDYEAYGKYIGDCNAEEYSEGIIEIR